MAPSGSPDVYMSTIASPLAMQVPLLERGPRLARLVRMKLKLDVRGSSSARVGAHSAGEAARVSGGGGG